MYKRIKTKRENKYVWNQRSKRIYGKNEEFGW